MFQWLKQLFSKGLGPSELSRRLDLTLRELHNVEIAYRTFQISKKSGKSRRIDAPTEPLKKIQRRILRRLLAKLQCHPLATGFQPGLSFVENARCHQYQAIVIRLDLKDFFPSISESRVEAFFRGIGWDQASSQLLTSLTTYQGALPQGAPTSPRLSNLVTYRMDVRLAEIAELANAVYTRYADDITFSLAEPEFDVKDFVRRVMFVVREEGFQPHIKKKFDVRRRHHRQIVTGLVVNEIPKLPRETRRWLRSVRHRATLNQQLGYLGPKPTLTQEQLDGWNSLEAMIRSKSKPT